MLYFLLTFFAVSIAVSCITLGMFLIKARHYDLKLRYALGSAASFIAALVLIKLMLG